MTSSLPQVAHEHHARIMHTVDTLPALGDDLMTKTAEELAPRVAEVDAFFSGVLLPHLEAAEKAIYPELERMMQNRHSMTPMRHEHRQVRNLIADFHRLGGQLADASDNLARKLALRRVIFRLYALLKVHLVEEELYVGIVNKGVTADVADVLAAGLDHPIATAG
ncbi:MAG: hemerythrin domain-containing protein [Chloroflexi bacterium]|jgi:hypothetical protein|nr:hemerythrin domain-containing protein [Chloroflexota bacterium]